MKNFTRGCWKIFLGLLVAAAFAAPETPAPQAFHPRANNSNVIRLWGNPSMAALVRAWSEGFSHAHPEWKVEARLTATGLAMPGLYTGAADIALFGRDTNVTDNDGFEHVLNYPPLRIELATGSLDVPGKSCALAVFVSRDNPLTQLTLAQLDALFGDEFRRGHTPIRRWSELGVTGALAAKPISLYGYDPRSGPGVFFRHVALNDSQKMHGETYAEFSDHKNPDGSVRRAGAQAIAALARDPAGIAIATPGDANSVVKMVAIAADDRGPFFLPTNETLIARSYPFARPVFACVNRPPGAPFDPKVRAFLAFVLSDDGQRALAASSGYLPLSLAAARVEQAKLN